MTITVKLDPELERRVRDRLDGVTLSEFVRRALVEKLEREDTQSSPYELWQKCFDDNDGEDASERIGDLVKERLRAKHRAG